MNSNHHHLIWIDLEMTGLDPLNDHIIEIATLITDADLKVVAEGPSLAVHQSEAVLAAMDEWNTSHHGQSGLITRVRESSLNVAAAESMTLEFIKAWVPARTSPICGNSICQDRRFLARHMPELEAYFHYRNLDVSSVKELVARWAPEILEGFKKRGQHRALDDIRESIEELRYYRETVFKI